MMTLHVGATTTDLTPRDSQFLFGYPHVKRYSTGVHDPLLCAALFLNDGTTSLLLMSVDLIFVSKELSERVARRIAASASIKPEQILIAASHTHSGPIMVDYLACEADPVVPKADSAYLAFVENQLVEAGLKAIDSARPAEIGLTVARAQGIGTNRRDPQGPTDPDVPVLLARTVDTKKVFAAMMIYGMHPTVLHEDSTLISADFPGFTRQYLQQNVWGVDCPILYFTGPAGNQSPRHCVESNTFPEAERLGKLLATSVEESLRHVQWHASAKLSCARAELQLALRQFPSVEQAQANLDRVAAKLHALRESGAPRTEVRTVECDWFGAEETLTLARAAKEGRLNAAAAKLMPARITVVQIGPWSFVGWPGEMFVEFSLEIRKHFANTYLIAYANGELQGYMVTQGAVDEGGYEASNSLFKNPESGWKFVEMTTAMLNSL